MRNFIRASLLAAVSFGVFVQAEEHMHADLHDKRGLSDILGALGLDGKKGKDSTETQTVTVQAQAAKGYYFGISSFGAHC
jgi:hypothetical protein